uniref:Uncharacterized protein n=1 Tax=Anguilla anguilla TaxID=7936 RepID=A0A0E9T2Z9_ANGAN
MPIAMLNAVGHFVSLALRPALGTEGIWVRASSVTSIP